MRGFLQAPMANVVQLFLVTVENMPRQEKESPVPAVQSNNGLKDNLRVFSLTSINKQRPKLRVCVNGIFITDFLDTDADVSIITLES